jgi:hypothetical protein
MASLSFANIGTKAEPLHLAYTAPRTRNPHYDYRIDFFRGLSLIFIFINHIPDNAFSYLTSKTFALFDSAEVFMFLAGYSAALGYYSVVPQGLQALAKKALGRARAILAYHIVLVVLIITAAFCVASATELRTGYDVFFDKIARHPIQSIVGIPLLGFQAPLLDILPMYIVVMLLAPYLVWLRSQSELALLAVSGLMWMFASRFFPAIPTVTYDVSWFFNPFCWQFLFAIGLAFGWRARTNMEPAAAGDARRVLDICCGLFVIFSACVLMTIAFESVDGETSSRLGKMYFSLNKQCLDLWRVVGLLASAYLAARLVNKDAGWLKMRLPQSICAAGRASLPIFSLTVVLSLAGKFVLMTLGHSILADALVTCTGIVIILATGLALRHGAFRLLVEALFGSLGQPTSPQTR